MSWVPGHTLEYLEKQAIVGCMRWFNNRRTSVAQALDISERTLYSKLKHYGWKDLGEEPAAEAPKNVANAQVQQNEVPQVPAKPNGHARRK